MPLPSIIKSREPKISPISQQKKKNALFRILIWHELGIFLDSKPLKWLDFNIAPIWIHFSLVLSWILACVFSMIYRHNWQQHLPKVILKSSNNLKKKNFALKEKNEISIVIVLMPNELICLKPSPIQPQGSIVTIDTILPILTRNSNSIVPI